VQLARQALPLLQGSALLGLHHKLGLRVLQVVLCQLTLADVLDDAGKAVRACRERADALVPVDRLRIRLERDGGLRSNHLHETRQILLDGRGEKLADAPADDLFAGHTRVLGIGIIDLQNLPVHRPALLIVH